MILVDYKYKEVVRNYDDFNFFKIYKVIVFIHNDFTIEVVETRHDSSLFVNF